MGFEKGDAPMLEFLGRAVFAILFTVSNHWTTEPENELAVNGVLR